ncbi:MAG: c-type cytochrome, partial [Gammaproteobacteria bacterium]|nr:c-type cytochrome [Gammaproteobacteria bacterium]
LLSATVFCLTFSAAATAADVNKLIEPCTACHGKDGNTTEADVPNIAGYSVEYFASAFKKYNKQERPCVETEVRSGSGKGTKTDMCKSIKDLSEGDLNQIAEYFAGKTFVRTAQTTDPALVKKGKSIHEKKCENCHSEAGSFPSDNAGMLGGQKMSYLKSQLKLFREGKRPMTKKMKPKLESLDDAEIEAVVHYYGSIQ